MHGGYVTHGQYIPMSNACCALNRGSVSDSIQLGQYIYQQDL